MTKKPTAPTTHPFKGLRLAGVPLAAYETADPAATIISCQKALVNGKTTEPPPVIVWDIIRGAVGANESGSELASALDFTPINTGNPAEALSLFATKANELAKAIIFFSNVQRFLTNDPNSVGVLQGIWNCRDAFKSVGTTLVLLAPSLRLPDELKHDVIILADPLPDETELSSIVDSITQDAGLPATVITDRARVLDTLRGLSAFEAEQVFAMSLRKEGVDQAGLWQRKVKMIESCPGLTVYKGREKAADVGGLANAKQIIGDTIKGKMKITCLVLIDEMDKAMSASTTDTSGTTQDQNKVLLSYMQDEDLAGALFLGPPGTGKTLLCKAMANEYNIPLIMVDLGALKGSLVGQSEQQMREAIKIIHAISDGRAFWIGACNRTDSLPPELRRRFNYLSMFFDLPDEDERRSAWAVHQKAFEITTDQALDTVNDLGWTGAEIKNCCLKAWAMETSLATAAKTIVPISKSAADIVQTLRKSASGKYISSAHDGLYSYSETPQTTPGRKVNL